MIKKNNLSIVVIILIGLSLACSSLDDETAEVNKTIDQVNVLIPKYNDLLTRSNALYNDLMTDNWRDAANKAKNLPAYKEKNKARFDELIDFRVQLDKTSTEVMESYDKASKLKSFDEIREYMALNLQAWKKTQERDKLMAPFVKAALASKDGAEYNKLLEEFDKNREKLEKEDDDQKKKVEQYEQDHPNFLKNDK